ncbi:hypothetical protein [Brevibacterium album]|uniref:hypothetical protein n=1 Tax=Brevibacterium album TaxID=417948 RepID=UPI00040493C3|nr:hypothetical protein [Brevibacterium album]
MSAAEARPAGRARLRGALVSALVVVLVLALLAAASAVVVKERVERLSSALEGASASAEDLFDDLIADPEAASDSLDSVRVALDEARDEMTAFPMPVLEFVPGVRKNTAAGAEALDVADSLVDDVVPTLIDAAVLVDLSTGRLRNPGELSGGWGQSADSAQTVIREGADALDELCGAADRLEAIDTAPLMDQVAGSVTRFAEAVRGACEQASEYETALDALSLGGQLADQLGEWGRELGDRLGDLGDLGSGLGEGLRLPELGDLPEIRIPGSGELPEIPDLPPVPHLPGL